MPFDNIFIILTSNIGSELYASKIGLRDANEEAVSAGSMLQAVEKWFSPELINRLSHVVVFQSLSKETVRKIAVREVNQLMGMSGLRNRNMQIEIGQELLGVLVERGYDRRYGARAMQRTVLSLVADPLGEIIAASPDIRDRTLLVDWQDGPVCREREQLHER